MIITFNTLISFSSLTTEKHTMEKIICTQGNEFIIFIIFHKGSLIIVYISKIPHHEAKWNQILAFIKRLDLLVNK